MMAPAWCMHMQCESWKGSPYAYGETTVWIGQVVTRTKLSERPVDQQKFRSTMIQAAASRACCARCIAHAIRPDVSNEGQKSERQQLLWKTFFQDHTRWWDCRHNKKNPRSPDFRHKESGEPLWLNNCYKPAWVDAQLVILDARADHILSLSPNHADQFDGPGYEHGPTQELVKKLCKQGQVKAAVEVLEVLLGTNLAGFDKNLLYCVLKECVARRDVKLGGQVHALALKMGFGSDLFLCTHFIRMYAAHGKLQEAMEVFGGVAMPDAFMWSSIISAHTKHGLAERAIELHQHMQATGTEPNAHVFVAALQACAAAGDLQSGKQLHSQIKERGLESDMLVSSCLVHMYAKCNCIKDARTVFDGLHEKDVVTWTAMIAGYAQQEGMGQDALNLHRAMHDEGMVIPDAVTLVCLLQACANVGGSALEKGKQLHSQIRERGLEYDVTVGSSLVTMYVGCGRLTDARAVFDGLREKNVVTWNAMISGYAQQEGMGQGALSLYTAMQNDEDVAVPTTVTFVCLLEACANMGVSAFEKGKELHSQIRDRGFESDIAVGGSLVNMYANCGSLTDARIVFDGLREKNVVTWTAMISGYAQKEGMGQDALSLYSAMHTEGMVVPNAVTFVCLLQACASMGVSALEKGKALHSQIKERGFESDIAVGGSLVKMYAKCGSLTDARAVFDGLREKNVVTWNAMISGYAQQEGMGQDALGMYSAMLKEGIATPDRVTFVCLLQACPNMGVSALQQGKEVHSQINELGLESDIAVGGNLVEMYAKCGSLTDARAVFDGLCEKNVVTWNAMISGYAQQEGMGRDALSLYVAMRNEGKANPNAVTYVCLLQACASVGALQQGKELHSKICEGGMEFDALVGNCLVNMYAQCGRLEISRQVFDRLPEKSVESWNALINGYAEHGEGDLAIQCFEVLLEQGIQPDEVTYISLITACSRAGLVDEGQRYFEAMEEEHGVTPDERHYNCMVDLFGRSGHLDRAEQMLRASDLGGSVVSWRSLLSGCKSYGDEGLGRRCFDQLVNLEPTVASAYAMLGSIYANAGKWGEVEKVEILRKAAGARKKAAKACIEVNKEVHEFRVGEEWPDVAATLRKMNTRVKEGGHVPQTQLVLGTKLSEQEKEDALCGHAEKLALAYGLLNTPAGSPLVVTKNLRMCRDCHSSTKTMSRVERREIVVRDGHKVHRFENGACSCQDRP